MDIECVACKASLNCHQSLSERTFPAAGDITFCAHCGVVMVFREDGAVDEATQDLVDDLPEELRQAMADVRSQLNPYKN